MIANKIEKNNGDVNKSVFSFLIKHIYRRNIMTFPEMLNFLFTCIGVENKRFQKKIFEDEYLRCRLEEYKRLKALMENGEKEIKRKNSLKYF